MLSGCVMVGLLGFLVFDSLRTSEELNYYLIPVLVLALSAFFISWAFFSIYDMAVDTLFLCFCESVQIVRCLFSGAHPPWLVGSCWFPLPDSFPDLPSFGHLPLRVTCGEVTMFLCVCSFTLPYCNATYVAAVIRSGFAYQQY